MALDHHLILLQRQIPPRFPRAPFLFLCRLTSWIVHGKRLTQQLRVHCAHREGLGRPIKGDNLYGTKADRLYLHAEYLSFVHPQTGERVEFECSTPF